MTHTTKECIAALTKIALSDRKNAQTMWGYWSQEYHHAQQREQEQKDIDFPLSDIEGDGIHCPKCGEPFAIHGNGCIDDNDVCEKCGLLHPCDCDLRATYDPDAPPAPVPPALRDDLDAYPFDASDEKVGFPGFANEALAELEAIADYDDDHVDG